MRTRCARIRESATIVVVVAALFLAGCDTGTNDDDGDGGGGGGGSAGLVSIPAISNTTILNEGGTTEWTNPGYDLKEEYMTALVDGNGDNSMDIVVTGTPPTAEQESVTDFLLGSGVSATPDDAKLYIASILAYDDGLEVGTVDLVDASAVDDPTDFTGTLTFVQFLWTDKDVAITGTSGVTTFDASAKAGWNILLLSSTFNSSVDITGGLEGLTADSVSYTIGSIPSGARWYYSENPN